MPKDSLPSEQSLRLRSGYLKRYWAWPVALLALAATAYLIHSRTVAAKSAGSGPSAGGKGSSGQQGAKGQGEGSVPVVGARARRGNIGVYFTGLGTVTPISTVIVKTRVDGELMNVKYREGDMVQRGDLLMEIDPRPYQVQLEQAQGQMAKDQAALDNARVDLARYEQLVAQRAVPEQQLATQKATVAQDEGVIKSDQAQIDSAKLNLTYTRITAPNAGRIGLRLVDSGNIVHASDSTGLVVITQIDPISVIFTIAEDQLPQVLAKMKSGQRLSVDAYDRQMQNKVAQGKLDTADNEIDQTTGTIRLRASFDNTNQRLFPNQFVNARLLVEEKRGVVLLPSAAIQRTSDSTFVYLVDPDSHVSVRKITSGVVEGDDAEITSGLDAGDVVVVTGADKLQEGSEVTVQIPGEQATTPPANDKDAGKTRGAKKQGEK